ncbi:MAG: YD repeat-containing protein [Candidatus Endobugula sp.]|jgi:YD repeat-containing protein
MIYKKILNIAVSLSVFFFMFNSVSDAATWSASYCYGGFTCHKPVSSSAREGCAAVEAPERYELYRIVFSDLNPSGTAKKAFCKYRDKVTKVQTLYRYEPEFITGDYGNCKHGYEFSKNYGCVKKQMPSKACSVGNPILFGSGDKFQIFTDHQNFMFGKDASVKRYYLSDLEVDEDIYEDIEYKFSSKWSFSFSDRLFFHESRLAGSASDTYDIRIQSDSGSTKFFTSDDNINWQPIGVSASKDKVETLYDVTSQHLGWLVTYEDFSVQKFNTNGELQEEYNLKSPNVKYTFDYQKSSASFERWDVVKIYLDGQLLYTYDVEQVSNNYIVHKLTVRDDEQVYTYSYDNRKNLVSSTYPDSTEEIYHYESVSFKKALTGITNRSGERYVSWTYDDQGRASSSSSPNNVNLIQLDYSMLSNSVDPYLMITNPLGKKTSYHYSVDDQKNHLILVDGEISANCASANQAYTYDANGFMASKTDWKGNVTRYIHNDRGLETSRTEADDTPEARTILTEWHPTLNLRTKVTEPERETVFVYDAEGRLTSTEVSPR